MKGKRLWGVGIGVGIVVLAVVGAATAGPSLARRVALGTPAAATVGGETALVARGTLRLTADASGSLAARDEVALAFVTGGRVADVLVETGDTVEQGQVLARLDDAEAQEAVAQAENHVAQAELELALARAEADAGTAQVDLQAALAGYDEAASMAARMGDQLTAARVGLSEARDALARAQNDYNDAWDQARDWELDIEWKKDALENEREVTEIALEQAQYDLQVAQASYNLAVAGIGDGDVRSAESQVAAAQLVSDTQPLRLQQLELSLAEARLSLQSAQRKLVERALTAPFAGTVTAVGVSAGEMANAGQTAVELADLDGLVVEINLDETDVAQVQLGQEALVTVEAFPGAELSGRVTEIAPAAEVTSGVVLYPLRVELAQTSLPLRAGMTADVAITLVSHEDALLVPLRALHSDGDTAFVLRQVQGSDLRGVAVNGPETVTVTLGLTTDTQAEILSGLEEGDTVIVVAAQAEPAAGGLMDGPFGLPFRILRGEK
jgi:HlyD family secretion protein